MITSNHRALKRDACSASRRPRCSGDAYAFLLTTAAHAADKPNVIFLLADDIGYADLSCYGAKHAKTPNLDRLAAQGCRFTDAHSPASTCTPTRRAFFTGVYLWRQQPGSSIAPGDAPLNIPAGTVAKSDSI